MTRPKTLGAYADCAEILDLCLTEGTIEVPFPTHADATVFRQRCYYYRTLLQKESARKGHGLQSPYDALVITKPAKGMPHDEVLTFASRTENSATLMARVRRPDGTPVAPAAPKQDLDAELQGLRAQLNLEIDDE
jgi:hypothetical protein